MNFSRANFFLHALDIGADSYLAADAGAGNGSGLSPSSLALLVLLSVLAVASLFALLVWSVRRRLRRFGGRQRRAAAAASGDGGNGGAGGDTAYRALMDGESASASTPADSAEDER